METKYDKEVLIYLKNNGFLNIIRNEDKIEDVIRKTEEHFIMGFSGIDWTQNDIIFSQHLSSDSEKYLEDAKIFLIKISKKFPQLLSEKVFVIGDNLTNLSYLMIF